MEITFKGDVEEFNVIFRGSSQGTGDTQVLALLQALKAQGDHMADSIETLKKNQELMKEDLDTIGAAVGGALESNVKLSQENAALKDQISGLVAGEALTQEKIDALVAGSDAVTEQADAIAQKLTPAQTLASKARK